MENCFDCKTLQTEKHELAGGWLNAEKNWRREKESLEQRLAAAESRIAELVSGIKEAQIELIETGKIYALGLSCQKRLVTELEQRLAAAESQLQHEHCSCTISASIKENPMTPTSEEIRAFREASGLTQAQAAALVYRTERNWQQWEAGERQMDIALWELVQAKMNIPCQHCGKSPAFLITFDYGQGKSYAWQCASCDDEETETWSAE